MSCITFVSNNNTAFEQRPCNTGRPTRRTLWECEDGQIADRCSEMRPTYVNRTQAVALARAQAAMRRPKVARTTYEPYSPCQREPPSCG